MHFWNPFDNPPRPSDPLGPRLNEAKIFSMTTTACHDDRRTSALMAIVLDEPEADACIAVLDAADALLISAATVVEALILSYRRNVAEDMQQLIDCLGLDVVPVTFESARRTALAYTIWGKETHPAAFNFGDCFAYDVAKTNACRLLYVGQDFAQTDIESARRH